MKKNTKKLEKVIGILILIIIIAISLYFNLKIGNRTENAIINPQISYEISNIPEYSGETYIKINNDIPKFTTEDMYIKEDYYSELKSGKVRNGNAKN